MNLSPEESKLFYRLYYSAMAYANRRLKIVPDLTDPKDVGFRHPEERIQMRDAFYEHPELLEEFLSENPYGFPRDELAMVASWQHAVAGEFYVLRYLKKYAVFLGAKPERLYGVLSPGNPLEMTFAGYPLPLYVKGALLPFQSRIIYDGLLSVYSIHFGPGIRASMNETYSRLKTHEGIVEQLVGPDGQPEVRTSLARQKPRKAAPDWRPAVDGIVDQAEKMREADTARQRAALGLLRAAARMAQAALHQTEDTDEHLQCLRSVRQALTRLEKTL